MNQPVRNVDEQPIVFSFVCVCVCVYVSAAVSVSGNNNEFTLHFIFFLLKFFK